MQAVPCGARPGTRLLGLQLGVSASAQIRSIRKYNTDTFIYFKDKTILTFGQVQVIPQENKHTSSS